MLGSRKDPRCAAPAEEARHIIKKEGSLIIERFRVFQEDWDSCMGNDLRFDKQARDKYITMSIRVVIESSLDIVRILLFSGNTLPPS